MKAAPLTTTSLLPKVAVLLLAAVVGCLTSDCSNGGAITALTFNTGLTPVVSSLQGRRADVIEALGDHADQADVMCLQELWLERDVQNIIDELGDDFPYHYSAIHSDVGELRDPALNALSGSETVACKGAELSEVNSCLFQHCAGAPQAQLCMVQMCGYAMFNVSADCRSCLSIASSGYNDILASCANTMNPVNRINRPGLMMLSKQNVSSVRYVNYHAGNLVLLERGYIMAQGEGGLTFVCTHLTANLPLYLEVQVSQYQNYVDMQAAEILQLNDTFYGIPHVLLGDLNTGPAWNVTGNPILKGELPANYDLLTDDLCYRNPYLSHDGRCTYCSSENPILIETYPSYGDIAIDHVLTSHGVTADASSAKRVFDQPDVILSDHYGVQVAICRP